jgi:hypothetical protein
MDNYTKGVSCVRFSASVCLFKEVRYNYRYTTHEEVKRAGQKAKKVSLVSSWGCPYNGRRGYLIDLNNSAFYRTLPEDI